MLKFTIACSLNRIHFEAIKPPLIPPTTMANDIGSITIPEYAAPLCCTICSRKGTYRISPNKATYPIAAENEALRKTLFFNISTGSNGDFE